ncbi:MAG: hypothetical protein ACLSTT_01955 [Evtepia gabavorous]
MKPRFLTSHYAWIQGCYWMAYCILLSFSSVYLLDQGFSNTQIGLLLGLSAFDACCNLVGPGRTT